VTCEKKAYIIFMSLHFVLISRSLISSLNMITFTLRSQSKFVEKASRKVKEREVY